MANPSIELKALNISKGEVMNGDLFTKIQNNFDAIKGAINGIPVFEPLEKIDALASSADIGTIRTAYNKLLNDLLDKGYMSATFR